MDLQTPILLCLYNRPDLTRSVFSSIAAQRPDHLLVSCDGPRHDHPNDYQLVDQTRSVVDAINWPCELQTLFTDENIGRQKQMIRAITWALEQHEQVIILEDDCLPDPTFYSFCQQLLNRYSDTDQIMMISGDNFHGAPGHALESSYYFSGYSHLRGWATWRRTWQHFDPEMDSWSADQHVATLSRYCCNDDERHYWEQIFDRQKAGEIDVWDYNWQWTCWQQHGLVALPVKNLIMNTGVRADGSDTPDYHHWLSNSPVQPVESLIHPRKISRDWFADSNTWHRVFAPPATISLTNRRPWFLQKLWGRRAA